MSRMLQALKKLEKRSAWSAAPSVVPVPAPAPAPVVPKTTPAARVELPPVPPVPIEPLPEITSVVLQPLPSFLAVLGENSAYEPVSIAESPRLLAFPTPGKGSDKLAELEPVIVRSSAAKPAAPEPPPTIIAKPPVRQPSRLERAVSRTLADPVRSEPFRQAAERLAADAQEIAGKTLLLTGVGPLSESHEVVLHAAAALAGEAGPILVIDGDLSRHTLADHLGLPDERGLGDVLRGDSLLADVIAKTTLEGVSFLPAGRSGLILTSTVAEKLPELFDSLAEEYRLILIDGGPAGDPAAATLARLTDATYFVVRLGATEAGEAQAALRAFRGASARVLGCIATS